MTEIEQQREKKAMEGLNLKEATIQFVHDRCTDLGYDAEKTAWEEEKGINLGKSMKENQIPYNQQMDIDRLCLENALKRFLDSGAGKDAFDVYFCYMEMFIGNYGSSRMMVELLSEFESNGSSVLLKHRDHYAHSVYVFCLGLAVFETNENFREIYTKEYHIEEGADSKEAAHHFLKTWGLTNAELFNNLREKQYKNLQKKS